MTRFAEASRQQKLVVFLLAGVVLCVLPFFVQMAGNAWVRIIDIALLYVLLALGLNVVVGYAGLLDLGYVAFYAIGAYMAGWFASSQFATHRIHFGSVGITPDAVGFHFSIWLILAMAGIVTAFVGIVIGLPTLRLRGDYLAIVT